MRHIAAFLLAALLLFAPALGASASAPVVPPVPVVPAALGGPSSSPVVPAAPGASSSPVVPAAPGGPSPVPVTRAQFVQTLWEQWGSVPYWDTGFFSDVGHGEPYTDAVCWAYDMGFTRGVGNALFEPERPITREEAAILLRRAAAHIGRDTENFFNTAECNDFEDISPWADDSLYWATATGLIDWAKGGLRAPTGTLSPEEAAAIFERFQ